jgi:PAS domain S-box-containing protein
MGSVPDNGLSNRLNAFAALAAWTGLSIGAVVLLGWLTATPALTRIHPAFATTKVNTALSLVLLSVGLLSITSSGRSRTRPAAAWMRLARHTKRMCGTLALTIALMTLVEYALNVDLRLDHLFWRDLPNTSLDTAPTDRMALATAVMVALLALAQLIINVAVRSQFYPAQFLAGAVGAIGVVEVLGYAYGVQSLYSVPMFGSVGLLTASGLLVLALGTICARPQSGFMALVIAEDPGGELARRLLPAAFLVPFVAGWLRLKGQQAGWYGTEFGLALFATTNIVIFSLLILRLARALARSDTVRRSSEDQVRVSEQRSRALLSAVLDGVVSVDDAGRVVECNRAVELMFCHSFDQLDGRDVADALLPADQRASFRAWLADKSAHRPTTVSDSRIEIEGVRSDGVRVGLEIAASPMAGFAVPLTALFLRDISARRQRDAVRERLAAIVESSDDAIISKTLEGTITSWNPGAERLFGYSSEEVIGRPMLILFPADRVGEEAEILAQISRGRTVDHFETQRLRKDGALIDVSVTTSPIKDATGVVIGASKIARDIGERRRADERVQTQVRRLHLLHDITRSIGERHDVNSIFQVVIRRLEVDLPLDFCAVALAPADESFLIVAAVGVRSSSLALELGLPEKARIAIDANGLARCLGGHMVYQPVLADLQSPFARRLMGGGLGASVFAPLRVESKVFGIVIAARRAANAFTSGDCEFLRQLSEHVALAAHQGETYTALQNAYEDLRRTQQAVMQQERLKVLGELASGVAHDINNALSPASIYAQMLVDGDAVSGKEAREQLSLIHRAIEDAATTVSRLKDFARSRDEAAVLTRVTLEDLVRHAVALTRASWHDTLLRGGAVIAVDVKVAPDIPAILGAESEIRDAVVNLIVNAVDAMPEGGVLTLCIRGADPSAHSNEPGGSVVLEVSDTGTGMSEEARRRCLEPFFSTKGNRGTGLGLAMVFGTMRRHAGELEIESEVGRGTTIRLIFPTVPAAQAAVPAAVLRRPARRLRLLLIDDDPLVLKTLSEMLSGDGHAVTSIDGGEAGIGAFMSALARGDTYDVVITDLGMPHVDGRLVASSIKAVSNTTPVILLTGWGRDAEIRDDPSIGADRVLGKPPRLNVLRHALAELCDRPDTAES